MSFPLKPLKDSVIVKLDKFHEKSNGGIIVSDTSAQRIRTATVVAVGAGELNPKTGKRKGLDLEPGERVAFLRWHLEHQQGKKLAGFFANMGGDLALIKERDILFAFVGELRIE